MASDSARANLPTHSLEVCPWTDCPVHAVKRTLGRQRLTCPYTCDYTTLKAKNLQDHLARTHHLPWWQRRAVLAHASDGVAA